MASPAEDAPLPEEEEELFAAVEEQLEKSGVLATLCAQLPLGRR